MRLLNSGKSLIIDKQIIKSEKCAVFRPSNFVFNLTCTTALKNSKEFKL